MLGMPDAAMVDQMATKEQVPDDMMVLWLSSKGLPVTFASLVGRYRRLQAAANNPAAGAQMPKTTVAEDVNSGLASLQQNAVPPMPELTQLQDQVAPPPQMPQVPPDQGQMPPMPQMPPDQGQGPAGLAGLDPGVMGQGMAGGGIIAFANGQQVAQQQDKQNQQAAPAPAPAPASAPAPVSPEQAYEDIDAEFDSQIAELNKREVFQPKTNPAIAQERERLIAQKLADQHDMKQDQWDALIAQGQAIMEEASKPHEPGFSYMASMSAGTRAYINKIQALEKEHKTLQDQLDKEIIQQNNLQFTESETNRKAVIDAKNAITDKIDEIQVKQLENRAQKQIKLAELANATTHASASMVSANASMINATKPPNPTDYQLKANAEYAALKEANDKLPPDQRKSDKQLRQQASQNVGINDVAAQRQRELEQSAIEKDNQRLLGDAEKNLSDYTNNTPAAITYRNSNDANIRRGLLIEEAKRIKAAENQIIPQRSSSSSSASSASSQRRVNLDSLPSNAG